MKEYIAPSLVEILDKVEGVYAASGAGQTTPTPEIKQGDWKIYCEYRNHNSGSHSEVAIIGIHNGTHTGNKLTMVFRVEGIRLDTVKDNGGNSVLSHSETGFSIVRHGFFNPTERFEFNIQITIKDSPYNGSVGKTGEDIKCTIYCNSYIEE